MARLRMMLDQQLQHLQGVISKLANRLQRRLMAKQTRSWDFDLEEGILDAARLARVVVNPLVPLRSEEHTSELQSLMRISYAVFCLKKKKNKRRWINEIMITRSRRTMKQDILSRINLEQDTRK